MSENNTIEALASDNPNFIPSFSTDEIYVGNDMEMCLTDELQDRAYIDHTHSEYAPTNHTHDGYASKDDLETLEDVVATKANATHTHTEYASVSHSHSGYAMQSELDALSLEVDEKANVNHSHDEYVSQSALNTLQDDIDNKADINHTHDDYATTSHTHNGYSVVGHDHDDDYSAINHVHNNYATTTDLDEVAVVVSNKADTSHTHDGVYDVNGAANNALTSANAYTDSKIDALVGEGASTTLDTIGEISSAIEDNQDAIDLLNSAIGSKANVTDLNTHTNNTVVHITSAERNAWNAKSNFSGNYNDLTNKPSIPSIDGLASESYVDTQIDAIDIPSSLSDLTTDSTHRVVTDAEKATWNAKSNFSGSYNDLTNKPSIPSISGLATETYVDEAVETKANIAHSHAISDITNLQSTLNSKAASNHNHNDVYDALGTAETKAIEALNSAEEYADEIIANEVTARDSAIATAKSSAISTASSDATTKVNNHNVSISAHNDIRTLIADLTTKLNNFLDVDDTTTDELSEVIALINNNKGTLESLTTSKINVSDIVDNLTTSNASKVLSAKQGVVIKSSIDTLQTELDSHGHAIADISGLQSALDGKAATSHGTHVSYSTTAPTMDGTASVGTASTVARSDHKHPTDTSRASQTDLDALETVVAGKANSSHTHTIANITNLQTTLDGKASSSHTHNYAGSSSAGGSANSANKLATARTISLSGDVTGSTSFDGSGNVSITATVADDSHNHVVSNIDGLQSLLDVKSDNDHRHYPIAITVTGEDLNDYTDAGFYTFAQSYTPTNAPSGNVNGWLLVIPWNKGNGTIKQLWFRHGTVGNNDFETYVRTKVGTNAWGSWSKYYTTSNPPTYAEVGASPAFTNDTGGVEYSYGSGSGKNVLTEISNMPQGVHTVYAISGTTGNPKTNESFRFLIHKTSTTIGWIIAWDAQGSMFTNYQSAANTFKGWKCVYDANPSALWTGGLYMSSSNSTPQTVKPSKKLSECRNGWVLVWSDYDADTSTRNNTDIHHDYVFKKNCAGANWSGQCMLCDIPRYVGSNAQDVDTERRIIKPIYIHDDRIEGSYQNSYDERADVVLRAVYEF